MRKTRGVLFILIGLVLAGLAGFAVLSFAKQAETNAAARAAASVVAEVQPTPKVFVVVALKDLPENVAISTEDIAKKQMPADFAPADAIAVPEIAVGKYTTSRIFRGEIIVSPLLAVSKQTSPLAARIPLGKVAMAVAVSDAMNGLGALRAGDHVDVLLSLDLKDLASQATSTGASQPPSNQNMPQLSTQLTMQNVEVMAIGVPAGDTPGNAQSQSSPQPQGQQQLQQAKTITFLLDRQDAITLKFIKDSGGTMDLVVRGSADDELAKTDAMTLDTVYRKFSFHFVQPVSR